MSSTEAGILIFFLVFATVMTTLTLWAVGPIVASPDVLSWMSEHPLRTLGIGFLVGYVVAK